MITRIPYAQLGHANHGWLDARHHFSFANYWNPARTGFGALLVINDDTIAPHSGFGAHPHDNMEIITYVRAGAITHQDSLGNRGRTGAGDVQVMSAGTGVVHAEHNLEDEPTRLYQIWIAPNAQDVAPRWEARAFPKQPIADGALTLLVSGRADDAGRGALFIHQNAAIWAGRLPAGAQVRQKLQQDAYVLCAEGEILLGDQRCVAGDGAEVTGERELSISATQPAEILVIEVPPLAA